MRLLIDECVDGRIVEALVRHGLNCALVRDLAFGAPDPDILGLAAREDRVVLTEDKGFGALAFSKRLSAPGIILIRTRVSDDTTARAVAAQVAALGDASVSTFTTIDEHGARARPFP